MMRVKGVQTATAIGLSVAVSAFASWCFYGTVQQEFLLTGAVAAFVVTLATERVIGPLRAKNQRLEAEVSIRSAELEAARVNASVAHEIKNPLGAVIGNLELAEEILASPSLDPEELLRSIRAAATAARHASGLVDDLSALGRTTAEVGPADLRNAAATGIARARVEAGGRIELALDDLPHVAANESRMVQVLLNLMINAALASRPGVENVVSVQGRVEGDRVHVIVTDCVTGMSSEQLARAFEPGFTTRAGRGGTGLGLLIVRNIVEGTGGEVRVDSTLGVGTRVHLWVPLAAESGPAAG